VVDNTLKIETINVTSKVKLNVLSNIPTTRDYVGEAQLEVIESSRLYRTHSTPPISYIPQIYNKIPGHQWLMSIILATWEAEVQRITVRGQPWQIVFKTPSPK
jgi:hypothetical protein